MRLGIFDRFAQSKIFNLCGHDPPTSQTKGKNLKTRHLGLPMNVRHEMKQMYRPTYRRVETCTLASWGAATWRC